MDPVLPTTGEPSETLIADDAAGAGGGPLPSGAPVSGGAAGAVPESPLAPAQTAGTAKEVSGSTETLAYHVDESCDILAPDLLDFNSWQVWRTGAGRRPTKVRDGYSTTAKFEADLWRATMKEVHGDDWYFELTGKPQPKRAARPPSPAIITKPAPVSMATPGITPAGGMTPRSSLMDDQTSDSWHTSDPGSPGALIARVKAGYNPAKTTFNDYEKL